MVVRMMVPVGLAAQLVPGQGVRIWPPVAVTGETRVWPEHCASGLCCK